MIVVTIKITTNKRTGGKNSRKTLTGKIKEQKQNVSALIRCFKCHRLYHLWYFITYFRKIPFKKLSDSLNDDEVFVVKRHPVMKEPYFENNEFEKIYDLTNESVLDLMIVADTVVTDYSSVIFEAVLLGKKILFYCPDFEEYDRSFYISYPDELPGNVVKESSELLQEIRNSQIDSKTETFKNKELFSCDGHSAEKTAKLIIEFLK